ncbi:MAG: 2-deoxyglucose-6-phosphatase [Candidatus Magasanikbacteria bacterium CG11_big_fil_rev_8_21_14_0_20_39_34]|uniref:2-deoxyglucose-6-phosphatase n=1 Tax=Candidatus Magasanikbacteria bacterium CG11_big_fil_rev_8_21_14_0_20_39_34 TaxID=1974653 RepID=A0A2H0N603_9BACT|nr:MAG: 2-deoxyglucose-6-phosphatase [Candidatus Magasanikbacteria bacterium CG11_big_fil_rev_8_21_14_0_20_39_34]
MAQAIIFDMDGLLIDSEPLWRESEVETFKKWGYPFREEYCFETMGMRVDVVVEHWIGKFGGNQEEKENLSNAIMDAVIERIHAKGELMPGVQELLNLFCERKIPMSIASSSYMRVIDAVVDKFRLKECLDVIYSAENEPFGKPHPGVYLTTAKKLHVSPEHCLVFEDSIAGVQAAKSAGMKCVAVPTKEIRHKKEFEDADYILDSLVDFSFGLLDQ